MEGNIHLIVVGIRVFKVKVQIELSFLSSNGQDIIHISIVLRKGVLEKTKDMVLGKLSNIYWYSFGGNPLNSAANSNISLFTMDLVNHF